MLDTDAGMVRQQLVRRSGRHDAAIGNDHCAVAVEGDRVLGPALERVGLERQCLAAKGERRAHAGAKNGLPRQAGAVSFTFIASREMITSTTMVAM